MRQLFVLMGAAVAAVVVWAPSTASAHASLESSSPAQGATVQTMPAQVTLTLTEPVQRPSQVEVTAPDGRRVNSETATVLDNTVTSVIDRPTSPGTYRMTYSIVSVDDHTVTGTIAFNVQASNPSAAPTTTPSVDEPAPSEPTEPSQSPTTPAGPSSQTQVLPDSGGSSTAKDAITIVGFSIVTMAGLVLVIRAGLKSTGAEDDD
ncbi:MAG: copCD [Aeromicrobium sp.]|jgi:methionine-rich copper-binding protein CopC|nr:copCD [Aeromicrobium sp.]